MIITESKFNDYNSNEKIKEDVSQIISSIYTQHRGNTHDIYKSISSTSNNLSDFKF